MVFKIILCLERNMEITRLDCNFRLERAQFHSDMEVDPFLTPSTYIVKMQI